MSSKNHGSPDLTSTQIDRFSVEKWVGKVLYKPKKWVGKVQEPCKRVLLKEDPM